jgi:hypothetical protein
MDICMEVGDMEGSVWGGDGRGGKGVISLLFAL